MTLNTLFATILPIGALLFFSLSTIGGLHSIRKLVRTSIPMRMSSRIQKKKSPPRAQVSIEMDPLTQTEVSEVGDTKGIIHKPRGQLRTSKISKKRLNNSYKCGRKEAKR